MTVASPNRISRIPVFPQVICVLSLILCLAASPAQAQSTTWTSGGADNNWNNVDNWDSGVPVNNDTIVIDNTSGSDLNMNNNLDLDGITLEVGQTSGDVTISGASIELAAAGIDFSGASLDFTMGTNFVLPTTTTFNVNDFDSTLYCNGVVSGSGGINKTGAGVLSFSVDQTYTGATIISNVDSLLGIDNGVSLATSSVTVNSDAFLDVLYNGSVLGSIHIETQGALRAELLNSGSLTLDQFSRLGGDVFGPNKGTDYMHYAVTGTVIINNAYLDGGIYYLPSSGAVFTIIDNDGNDPVVGTFVDIPEGHIFDFGYFVIQLSYKGGTGNDVVMTAYTAPDKPVAIDATKVTSSGFTANWNPVSGATGYYLQVACDWVFTDFSWGGFSNIDVGNVTSFDVTGLRSDWTYIYRVRAYNPAGTTAFSNTPSVHTQNSSGTPQPPDITAGCGLCPGLYTDRVRLTWGASSSVSEVHASAGVYRIYRAESPLGDKTLLGETSSNSYDDPTAEAGRRYYYWVTSLNGSTESAFGNYIVAWRYDKNPGRCGVFNHSGNTDLLWWGDTSNQISIWLMDGVNKTGSSPIGTTDSSSSYLLKTLGDFDGDGISDLLWWNPVDGNLEIWLANAAPFSGGEGGGLDWLIKQKLSVEGMSHAHFMLKAGDFDGDKKADILWRDLMNGNLSIWFMDGGAVLGKTAPAWGEGVQCTFEGEEDFNPSAAQDLPQPEGTLDWEIHGLADFTADGRSEILWRNPSDGRVVTWIMDGATITGCGCNTTANWQGWEIKSLKDLNGDERGDILWRNRNDGGLRTWIMDGSEITQRLALTEAEPALSWQIKDLGDFNNNGKNDIYWRDHNTGTVKIWLMDGAEVIGQGEPGATVDFE